MTHNQDHERNSVQILLKAKPRRGDLAMGSTRKPSGVYLWGLGRSFGSKVGHMSSRTATPPRGTAILFWCHSPIPRASWSLQSPWPFMTYNWGFCLSHVSSCEAQLTCLFTHLQSVTQLMRNLRLCEGRDSPKVTQLKNPAAELGAQILGKAGVIPSHAVPGRKRFEIALL